MLFPSFAVNQYVVEKYQDKFSEIEAKDIIYKSLEGRRSIAQAEWYN